MYKKYTQRISPELLKSTGSQKHHKNHIPTGNFDGLVRGCLSC